MSSIGIRNKKSIVLALRACTVAVTGVLVHTVPAAGVWRLSGLIVWWVYLASTVGLAVFPERWYFRPRFNPALIAFESLTLAAVVLTFNGVAWVFQALFLLVVLLSILARRLPLALVLGAAVGGVHLLLQFDGTGGPTDDPATLVLQLVLLVAVAGLVGYLSEEMAEQQSTTGLLESSLQISALVSGSLDAASVYERLTDVLARLFHAGRVAVIHVEPGAENGRVIAAIDRGESLENIEIPLEQYPEIQAALVRQEPVVVGNTSRHPALARIDNSRLRNSSILVTPIIVDQVPKGVIFVRLEDWARGFTPQQVAFTRLMADASSQALAQAERFARIEELAHRDSLTGLHNLRSFHRRLDFELAHAESHDSKLALLMIDLDFLKRVNDGYGHLAGDEVLKHVARSLKREVRDSDFCARYGGEEFAVVLTAAEEDLAERIADRIRVRVDRDSRDRFPEPVTVSIGIAMYPTDASNPRDLLHHADQALYYSKYRGRNRVSMYVSLQREIGADSFDATLLEAFTTVAVERHFDHQDPRISAIREKLSDYGGEGGEAASGTALDQALFDLTGAMHERDPETAEHLEKVARITDLFLVRLPLDDVDRRIIRAAAILHDIGKLGIRDEILDKPDFLTREEYEVVRRHPDIGAQVLEPLDGLEGVVPLVRHHHERWDGQGYPTGLQGDEIPFGARVVGLVDAFYAMISDRPYHNRGRDLEYACEEIGRHAGTQFDPHLATEFLDMVRAERARITAIASATYSGHATSANDSDPGSAESHPTDESDYRVLDLPTPSLPRPVEQPTDSSHTG